jgi:superfamily I DNA and/or RNA helicase
MANYDSLRGIESADTVDSFQGREAGIVVLILGTTRESGPGFTADEQRLK